MGELRACRRDDYIIVRLCHMLQRLEVDRRHGVRQAAALRLTDGMCRPVSVKNVNPVDVAHVHMQGRCSSSAHVSMQHTVVASFEDPCMHGRVTVQQGRFENRRNPRSLLTISQQTNHISTRLCAMAA